MPCLELLVAYSFWLIWLIGHNNLVRSDGDGNSNNEDQDNDTVQWKEVRCHSLSRDSYFSFKMGDCDLTSSNASVDLIESRELKEECVYEEFTHNSSYAYICLINPAFEGQVCCETRIPGDPKSESWCKNFPQSTPSLRVGAPSPTSSPTQPVSASLSMMSPSTLVSPTSPATGLSVGAIVGLCCVGVLLILPALVGVFLLVYCTCKRCKKKSKTKIKANLKREIDGLIVPPKNGWTCCDVEQEGIRREKRNKPTFPTGDTQSGPLASDSGLKRRSIRSI